jgi:hypothetical protein
MTSPPEPAWDDLKVFPSPRAHSLRVGADALLFDEAGQQIYQQNDTAAAIWDAVLAEGAATSAATVLAGQSGDRAALLEHVRQAMAGWLRAGLLRPTLPDEGAAPTAALRVTWTDCTVEIRLFGALDAAALRRVFAAFVTEAKGDYVLSAAEICGLVFVWDETGRTRACSAEEWIPEIKARLTERFLKAERPGFLAHAALLSIAGRGVLLWGAPGAGKTTLSVSLLLDGFDYHSDDIVWMAEDGRALGAPFSPAAKQGAWPLLEQMQPGLPASAAYLRGDGQAVRYFDVAAKAGPVDVAVVLLLARREEGAAAIEPVRPLEALTAILGSAYSARRALSASALSALVEVLDQARLGRLHYSRWADARQAVKAFLDAP